MDNQNTGSGQNADSHATPALSNPISIDEETGFEGADAGSHDYVTYKEKKYTYNTYLSNFLLLGIDTTGEIAVDQNPLAAGQADSIFLVSYDRKDRTVRILAIPRDTITSIYVYNPDGTYVGAMDDHISLQYAYGDGGHRSCTSTCEAVSNLLYATPIMGYTAINLTAIPLFVDAIGGVPLTVPDDSLKEINPDYTAGAKITLTAETAEAYLRYRDTSLHHQALVRMERQKSFINAFADRVLALQAQDAHTVTDLYESLKSHMLTNMSAGIYLDLAEAARPGGIETIPGEGVATETYDEYHVDEKALYELILDVFYIEENESTQTSP